MLTNWSLLRNSAWLRLDKPNWAELKQLARRQAQTGSGISQAYQAWTQAWARFFISRAKFSNLALIQDNVKLKPQDSGTMNYQKGRNNIREKMILKQGQKRHTSLN